MTKPIIEFKNVSFAYGDAQVLERVTFSIHERESVCMIGPNGGGKSTLLKLMLGLLRPAAGRITVFGKTPEQALHRIGYMPQYVLFDPQFPVTVLDIVLMGRLGMRRTGRYSRSDKESALEILGKLGLGKVAHEGFARLSGGQRQRALIARALVSNPDILLLDEPTANVDPLIEEKLGDILKHLNKFVTIIMVSHDLGFVSQMFKTVICVNRRVFVHPTGDITSKVIHELYSGKPRRIVQHTTECCE